MRSTSASRQLLVVAGAAALVAAGLAVAVLVRARHQPAVAAPLVAGSSGAAASRLLGERLLSASDPQAARAGVQQLVATAANGEVEAEVALGRIYLRGLPAVAADPAQARTWLTRAQAAGHPSAAYYLGVMSANGLGSPADARAAARWFEVAAKAGSPHALFMLGNAYRAGAGVPRDEARAVALYQQAAELDDAAALQTLAMAYLHGELGLGPDEIESRHYAMEAEHAAGHSRALP
jgi:uncharacterized protein